MLEKVNFTAKAYDNYIEITPDDGIFDNCMYEIKLHNLKSADGVSELNNQKIIVYTKICPAYTTVEAVKSLLYNCGVPDPTILYHIREASKFVEYVTNKTYSDNYVPYNVFEYVKYKSAYDSLISFTVNGVSNGITKGTMGDVSYEKEINVGDLTDLLKLLKEEVNKWYDSLFGVMYKGPASPSITVKSSYIVGLDMRNDDPPIRTYYK